MVLGTANCISSIGIGIGGPVGPWPSTFSHPHRVTDLQCVFSQASCVCACASMELNARWPLTLLHVPMPMSRCPHSKGNLKKGFLHAHTNTSSSYNTFTLTLHRSGDSGGSVLVDSHRTDVEDGVRAPGFLPLNHSSGVRVLDKHVARRYLHIHYGHVGLTLSKITAPEYVHV